MLEIHGRCIYSTVVVDQSYGDWMGLSQPSQCRRNSKSPTAGTNSLDIEGKAKPLSKKPAKPSMDARHIWPLNSYNGYGRSVLRRLDETIPTILSVLRRLDETIPTISISPKFSMTALREQDHLISKTKQSRCPRNRQSPHMMLDIYGRSIHSTVMVDQSYGDWMGLSQPSQSRRNSQSSTAGRKIT